MLERRPDPSDGRAKFVTLAARGQAALKAARRFHASYERKLEQALGTSDAMAFRSVLERLAGGAAAADAVLRSV